MPARRSPAGVFHDLNQDATSSRAIHRACKELLFEHVPIPPENIHTINPDLCGAPADAAAQYEAELRAVLPPKDGEAFKPRFDLILLGMGPDGHTVRAPCHPICGLCAPCHPLCGVFVAREAAPRTRDACERRG